MAYVQTQNPQRRALTIGAVGVLHAALGYALIAGFAADFVEDVYTYMPTADYPAEPPPPSPVPSVEPSKTVDRNLTAPRPDLDLGPRETTAVEFDLIPLTPPGPLPGLGDPGPVIPSPSPSASFTPRAATPLGSPGK